jgi:hypothetical protein
MGAARDRIRSEDGFALATVILMMLAGFAIASAAVYASVGTQHGSIRDEGSKLSVAAAESGVSAALTRYNSVPASNAQPCLSLSSGGAIVAAPVGSNGWCPPVGPGASNGGTYSYQVKPTYGVSTSSLPIALEVVSTGTVNGVTSRVKVTADSASGSRIFCPDDDGDETCDANEAVTVQAANGIVMNANATLQAASATNGDISAASNAKICGLVSVGVGRRMLLTGSARYYSDAGCSTVASAYAQQPLSLPPINPGDSATSNDNQRITNAVAGSGSPSDLVSGNRGNVSWSSSTRNLTISANTQLNLTGSKYSLCSLTLSSNTSLSVAANQNTAIFFDSPESCGLPSGRTQLNMSSNSSISSSSGSPTNVAFYFVGSSTLQTFASFSSNTQLSSAAQSCASNFVIYAPRTDVTMNSNSTYCGALAARSLQMGSNARIVNDTNAGAFTLASNAAHFEPGDFIQCSAVLPAGSSNPTGGC